MQLTRVRLATRDATDTHETHLGIKMTHFFNGRTQLAHPRTSDTHT